MSERATINVIGGLFAASILDKVAREAAEAQASIAYDLPKNQTLRDKIAWSWRSMVLAWSRWEKLREEQRTPERFTKDILQILLGHYLDYGPLTTVKRNEVNGVLYPIRLAALDGGVPLLVVPGDCELDRACDATKLGQQRRSPAAVMQQYLNANSAALFGLVTNGRQLRLYRDNPMFTRPAYLEVDLETMLADGGNFADYSLLWLLLHGTRLRPREAGKPDSCILEAWRQTGAQEGERARNALRQGVVDALRALGTGFLEHRANQNLRDRLERGDLSVTEFYQQLLRLIYRLIFLATTEGRNLLLLPDADRAAARELYQQAFAVARLRNRARRVRRDRHHDLWQAQTMVFSALQQGQPALALPGLGGLFGPSQCPDLDGAHLANDRLLKALQALLYFRKDGLLVPVDFKSMDTEELGSVYEGLLELVPMVRKNKTFGFAGDDGLGSAGNQRKLTGSYYTPSALVAELVKAALEPVIAQRKREHKTVREAILSIRMIDPACGSGHFILAAGRVLALELAAAESESGQPSTLEVQHAMREVVQHCLYGVDLNPMAIELCKMALWLESVEPGQPMAFLDAHIRVGNALIGLLGPTVPDDGILPDAFKDIPGVDHKATCTQLRKQNAIEREKLVGTLRGTHLPLLTFDSYCREQQLTEATVGDVARKRELFEAQRNLPQYAASRTLADAWVAAYTMAKQPGTPVPTNSALCMALAEGHLPPAMAAAVQHNTRQFKPFHWHLEFPEVMGQGGFDVVMANPPWEKLAFIEKEFFANKLPEIAQAEGNARKRGIQALAASSDRVLQAIYQEYEQGASVAARQKRFIQVANQLPLTARGIMNLYALFAERIMQIATNSGRASFIVPTGIATDDGTKHFFGQLIRTNKLVSLIDFENRNRLFPIDSRMKFSLVTIGEPSQDVTLSFYNASVEDLADERRKVRLSPIDFAIFNPNTLTTPLPRTAKDLELLRKIYGVAPALVRENAENGNPWGFKPFQMFNMTSDSHLFVQKNPEKNKTSWSDCGGKLVGNKVHLNGKVHLPLYEGKMVHHYDHRFASYGPDGIADATPEQKADPNWEPMPQYWVDEWEVYLQLADKPSQLKRGKNAIDTQKWFEVISAWCAGNLMQQGEQKKAVQLMDAVIEQPQKSVLGLSARAQLMVESVCEGVEPLADEHLKACIKSLPALKSGDLDGARKHLLPVFRARSPQWLMGWRDIARATDERTIISSVIPVAACNNKYPLIQTRQPVELQAALYANLCTLVYDYCARLKIPSTTVNIFLFQQLPILPPSIYTKQDLEFILPRVVSIQYRAESLTSWAKAISGSAVDTNQKTTDQQLRAELDAYYALLYGLSREELEYVLNPEKVMGPGWPSVTFTGLKNNEVAAYGEYRTERLVMEAYDALVRSRRGRRQAVA